MSSHLPATEQFMPRLLQTESRTFRPGLGAIPALALIALAGCSQSTSEQTETEPASRSSSHTGSSEALAPALPEDARLELAGDASIQRLSHNDLAESMRDSSSYRTAIEASEYADAALEFLHAFRRTFGIESPRNELVAARVDEDRLGYHHVRFSQQFADIPVLGAELIVHFDENDALYLVNGAYLPTPTRLDSVPSVDESAAHRTVSDAESGAQRVDPGQLVIALDGQRQPKLAYQFAVTQSPISRYRVLVDAHTGAIVDRLTDVYH